MTEHHEATCELTGKESDEKLEEIIENAESNVNDEGLFNSSPKHEQKLKKVEKRY
jgi:tyrosine-protein phosphatase YwqE